MRSPPATSAGGTAEGGGLAAAGGGTAEGGGRAPGGGAPAGGGRAVGGRPDGTSPAAAAGAAYQTLLTDMGSMSA